MRALSRIPLEVTTMRTAFRVAAIVLSVLLLGRTVVAQKPKSAAEPAPKADAKSSATPGPREADEKGIRQSADEFAKAYNAHDAKKLAALFAADAEIVGEDGNSTQGRSDIEQAFGAIFADQPNSRMSIAIHS